MEHVEAAVVGGGQAGLAISRELKGLGIEHVVLERGRVAQTWRDRWESFCLVTPNWTVQLPGHPYDGADPDGFMHRDEIVAYFERYAAVCDVPVREGVDVRSIEVSNRAFAVRTSAEGLRADAVVIATGAYQRPHRPSAAATLPAALLQIDVEDYRSEQTLPPGPVLVVGSGQSGCQIAEELHEAGREVVLACGKAPWAPRRIDGRDLLWWAHETGFLDHSVESLPTPGRPARREHPHDRPWGRTRPPSTDASGGRGHADGTLPRSQRSRSPIRPGPRRERRLGRRALRAVRGPRSQARPGP